MDFANTEITFIELLMSFASLKKMVLKQKSDFLFFCGKKKIFAKHVMTH